MNSNLKTDDIEHIYKLALEREEMMEKNYLALIEQTPNKTLKSLFIMMAKEEGHHKEIIQAKVKKEILPDSSLMKAGNVILRELQNISEVFADCQNQLQGYCAIKKLEEESEAFYLKMAESCTSEKERTLLVDFSKEERKHVVLMDNLIELLSEPEKFVISPEFSAMIDDDLI